MCPSPLYPNAQLRGVAVYIRTDNVNVKSVANPFGTTTPCTLESGFIVGNFCNATKKPSMDTMIEVTIYLTLEVWPRSLWGLESPGDTEAPSGS